jgi:CRISPR/Cas system-associated protein Csm6
MGWLGASWSARYGEPMELIIAMLLAGASYNETVKVEGKSYRVLVREDEVKVFQKSFIAGQKVKGSTEQRAQMRQAVQQVTGCKLTDDFWRGAVLVGVMDCSGKAAN